LTTIGYLFPHSWAMDALLAPARPGANLSAVWLEVAVLAGMAVVVPGITLTAFRRRALTNV
jgi:ABC-2 type transport system permease protein